MIRLFTLALILCFTASISFAGHVDTYGIGSKGTSMGGAMTAATDDAFSVHYNPAAMSRIKKRTFAIGSHFVDPSLKMDHFNVDETSAFPISDLAGSDIKDKSPLLIVPHMAYVHPLNEKMTLGIAFYVPYGLDLKWDTDTTANPAAMNTFHSWYMREVITPSFSYKVNDKLSLGFGISIGKTKAGVERVRYVPDFMKSAAAWQTAGYTAVQAAGAAAAYTELDGAQYKTETEDDFNYSFNIGLLYDVNEKLSFGVTYRSKSDTKMDGNTDVTPDMAIWTNQNVDASVEIDTPDQLSFGVQYKPIPKWSISADLTRTWWGAVKSYTVAFEDPFMATSGLSAGADEEHFERNWKDTWTYRIGTEYKLNKMIDLRAGYYYDPTVVPNDTFDVLWPDSDKHVFSGGLGLNFEKVSVDFVLQYIRISTVNINGESENLNDSYTRPGVHVGEVDAKASGSILGYGVTVSYKF